MIRARDHHAVDAEHARPPEPGPEKSGCRCPSPRDLWLRMLRRKLARRTAVASGRACAQGVPPLVLVLEPDRTPDPGALIARLPRKAAVLFRHFGRADWLADGPRLARLARRRGVLFLVSWPAPPDLLSLAAGAHLPFRSSQRRSGGPRLRPGQWLSAAFRTGTPHRNVLARRPDFLLLSPVFPSRSPGAVGRSVLGPVRLAAEITRSAVPIMGLGGVSEWRAMRVMGTGAAGIAAVDHLAGAGF